MSLNILLTNELKQMSDSFKQTLKMSNQTSFLFKRTLKAQLAVVDECHLKNQQLLIAGTNINHSLAYYAIARLHGNVRFFSNDKFFKSDIIAPRLAPKKDFYIKNINDTLNSIQHEEPIMTPNGVCLRPYQQKLVDFTMTKKRVGLFVDMGLGKTLTTLATLNELVKTGRIDVSRPVLIVAPIMVALDTWSRESEKWGYDFDVLVNIHKTSSQRKKLFKKMIEPHEKLTLLTTNPDQLPFLKNFLDDNLLFDYFQTIIVDELSLFKSVSTRRFKVLDRLSRSAEYFIGLTGTPAPNNLLDIYSQTKLIDPKLALKLGTKYESYRRKFFYPVGKLPSGIVTKWKLKRHSDDKIYQILSNKVISMRSETFLELPPVVVDQRILKLPKKAQKTYDTLAVDVKQELLKLQNENSHASVHVDADDGVSKQSLSLPNQAVLTSKLLQLSSGAIYNDKSNSYKVYQDEKFKALKEIVETSTSPVLIFFYFKSELERMRKYFDFTYLNPKAKNAKNIISSWNKGEIPVMVAHPASSGHGLNLQDGGHIIVYLTLPWSNEQYRQSIKRLARSGQKYPVTVIHLIMKNTVDEEVSNRLDLKENGQQKLMKSLELK